MSKSILITGCSSGIGLGVATDLQKAGFKVFATCRKQEDVDKINAMGLMNLTSIKLDVTDTESIKLALSKLLKQTGGTLDVLYNNAGYGQIGAVEDLTKQAMQEQFDTNVFGLLDLTNHVLPIMRQQGSGKIIVTSSVLGFISLRYRGAYVASKFALEGLFDTLRLELKNTPISVSIIQPGPIESKFRDNTKNYFIQNINIESSAHLQSYQNMDKFYKAKSKHNDIFTLSHKAITKVVLKIINSDRPRARYSVTFPTYLFRVLTRVLPTVLLDKILFKVTSTETND